MRTKRKENKTKPKQPNNNKKKPKTKNNTQTKKPQTTLLQMLLVFKRYFEKVLPSFLRSFFNEAFLAFILDFVRRL